MAYRSYLLVLAFVVAGCDHNVPPPPHQAEERAAEAPPAPPLPLPGFSEPERLCDVLRGRGLSTRGWKADELGAHCSSDYQAIGSGAGAGLATNLAYYIEGKSESKADLAKLVLNVNNPSTRREGLQAMADTAEAFFEATTFDRPEALREKVLGAQPFTVETETTVVRFAKEQSKISTYRLEVEDAEVGRHRQLLAEGSAGLFRRCKAAIKKDLSYAKSLSGDGEPIEESGYVSFMIEGPGRDTFFCEAYPDGRYKIKAAFAGEFPFRDVAAGQFE